MSSNDTYPKAILISEVDSNSAPAKVFKESIESETKEKVS